MSLFIFYYWFQPNAALYFIKAEWWEVHFKRKNTRTDWRQRKPAETRIIQAFRGGHE